MKKKYTILTKITFAIYLLIVVKFILLRYPVDQMLEWIRRGYYDVPMSINIIPFKTMAMYMKGEPTIKIAVRNMVGNIIFFMPFGFLVPMILKEINSYKKIIIVSFAFSLSLEIAQIMIRVGSFDIDDLILNTAGAVLGYVLLRMIRAK